MLEDNINRLRALVDERQLKHLVRTYNFKAQFFHPHALSLHYRFTSSMQYSTTGVAFGDGDMGDWFDSVEQQQTRFHVSYRRSC